MPSRSQPTSIKGRKISLFENNPTFILLLCTLLVMVVLYLLDIYNCGPFLFGIVAFCSYIYVPKVWNEYEYIFVVTINGVSKQFSCISNSATVNTNFVIPIFSVINERVFQKGEFYIETQKIELTIAGFNGSFYFSYDDDDLLKCFDKNNITVKYNLYGKIIFKSTEYQFNDNINIKSECGGIFNINKGKYNVPKITERCNHYMEGFPLH